jgi:RNA polymerase sigma-70 factor (ECF subfamily)
MAENQGNLGHEDPMEYLLDEESDEEFGLPQIKERLEPAKLKDWTASDFASIYVRFRPHLERHAKRFLVNPSQVEEVVQDAFLYLMTTLPELDSEIGVLKFLKWKTRLLALDVIRVNSRASFAPIDEVPEMAAKVDDFNQELERADDAAIVAMAMAKLNPRHREALIATLYEEKSQEVVAAQMGLSENALRQLLFRARAAFKKALVGEAETQGKSVSQILSIAARKAAAESGKYLSAAGAFLLVLAVSFGILPNIATNPTVSEVAEQPTPQQPEPQNSGATSENQAPSQASESLAEETEVLIETVVAEPAIDVTPLPTPEVTPLPSFTDADFAQILNTNVSQAGFYTSSKAASFADFFQGESIEVFGGTGISAFVYVNPSTLKIENAMFQMWVDGTRYYAIARTSSVSNLGLDLGYQGSNFYVVDDQGRVFDASPLANASASVELTVDSGGKPVRASLKVTK